MDWAEKYRPRRLPDLVGNGPALKAMSDWALSWVQGYKPLLLHGKPGTGKTSAALALASDRGWDVIELNASDQRTKDVIGRIAGEASVTASLSGASRKLILFDEADNLHGTADRGGAREILEVIRVSRQPVILIANDLYGIPPEIRARCEPVLFRAVQARSVVPRLKFICASEGLACTDAALVRIAELGGGDIRASINMLQAAAGGRKRVTEADVASSPKDDRVSIFDLVLSVFRGREDAALLAEARAADEPPDTILQWIEGNLVHLPDTGSLAVAYRWVSRADEYLGLTFRRQYYSLWRYANALMLLGSSLAAAGRGARARLMPPGRWRRISSHRRQKAVRESLLRKVGEQAHIPQEVLREDQLTLLAVLVEADPVANARDLSLDEEELTMLIHDRARAREVIGAIERQEKAKEIPEKKPRPKGAGRKGPGGQSSLF
ncbi:MAG TPA: replication factor C large subunit [Methanomicrobiales archaeon]|jgi:replication factor C large subunit|nr:replication factor C large subunit [Methanomicrobiales archaeon]